MSTNEEVFKVASSCKKGEYVILNNRPCKITDLRLIKMGKHGSCKAIFQGTCIFSKKKVEHQIPGSHRVQCPIVHRHDFTVVGVDESGYLLLLNQEGQMKNDVRLGEDQHGIREAMRRGDGVEVQIISAVGEEKIVSVAFEKEETL